jgi:UDP-N-acetylmuramyl pentapeptide phosphotransferase/UDP-N-acetylglucosamine-1-phosphate transferase
MVNILLTVFISSFLMIWVIVKLAKSKNWFINEHDLQGVQKFHSTPTARIAGIPVFVSFFTGLWFVDSLEPNYVILLLASLPVFFGGLIEDITAKISPTKRMVATLVSIVILFFMGDITINFLGNDWIDYYLSNNLILSLLFTMLVVGGAVNSINIIDGYNGLVAGYSILVLLAIAYVASIIGDDLVLQLSLILMASLASFIAFNFPFGKIFLGDGGAYFIGFMMAIIGLMLGIRNEEVPHWFVLLLFIYPLYETVFSIYRKKIVRGTSPSQPDGLHLHMLIYKRLVQCKRFKHNKTICNSMTSPFLWALSLLGIIPAVIWFDNQIILIILAFVFMVIYTIIYRRIVHFKFKR